MSKKTGLKSSREAESRKVDLAVKYAEEGVASGGGHVNPKKVRHSIEARYLPIFERIPTPSRKAKHGRHHVPPSTAPRKQEE